MNYFGFKSAAERYRRGRPYFHPAVAARIKSFLSLSDRLPRALDAGCGTGLSTLALLEVAERIVGVDLSAEMVALAPRRPSLRYVVARGEELPFAADTFDLVTVSSALHWLDKGRFFDAARGVLRAGGWLVVYDNYFSGRMMEEAGFEIWFRESYLKSFPAPPRRSYTLAAEECRRLGFRLRGEEWYENEAPLTPDGLIDYLGTQSNIIAAVEAGGEDLARINRRLLAGARPFFAGRDAGTFLFRGPVWYLQKSA